MAIVYLFMFAIVFLHAHFLNHNLLPFGLDQLLDDSKDKIKTLKHFIKILQSCYHIFLTCLLLLLLICVSEGVPCASIFISVDVNFWNYSL